MKEISTDHKGIKYRSQKEMCAAYNISQTVFCKRIERGWSLADALEGKILFSKDGVNYYTQKEIYEAFNIHPNTLRNKLNQGYTYEEIINKQTFRVTDHYGNKYRNTEEMCNKYGKKVSTYRAQIRAGKSIKEALENI